MDFDLQGMHEGASGGFLLPRLATPEIPSAAGKWMRHVHSVARSSLVPSGEADTGGPQSPELKKAAVHGTWVTPTSTLEQALVSPVF